MQHRYLASATNISLCLQMVFIGMQ